MRRCVAILLSAAGAQAVQLSPEDPPREHYYGEPFVIGQGAKNFPPFPNLTRCPPGSVMAMGHEDGFGATFTAMVTVYNWARTHNKTFCAVAWRRMEHGGNASGLFHFIGGRQYGPKPGGNAKIFNQRCSQVLSPPVREEVRHFYWQAARAKADWEMPKPPLDYFETVDEAGHRRAKDAKTFVWHVRHGDVLTCGAKCDWRRLNSTQIVHGMEALLVKYREQLRRLHFITDGDASAFRDVIGFCKRRNIECELHTGDAGNIMSDFHHMVNADVLVMAHSTLSGMAGVISTGDIYDAHELAQLPLGVQGASLISRPLQPQAETLTEDERSIFLWKVQSYKEVREGKIGSLIGPIGKMCPE